MKQIGLIFFVVALCACGRNSAELNRALELAGENCAELEKVLDHYAQDPADSLKLKAAVFLIENMPGHYSVAGEFVDQFMAKFDQQDVSALIQKQAALSLPEYYADPSQITHIEDVTCITSEFLIRHIDKVFRLWEIVPWKRDTLLNRSVNMCCLTG